MQILARTYHVSDGVPPRRFAVTFELGGEHRVEVASEGARRLLKFNGRGYRPGSRAHLRAVVDRFRELDAREEPLERANDELRARGQEPAIRRQAAPCECDDRQLPAGDRT